MENGDNIASRQGDGGRGVATGKDIDQNITDNKAGNVVNVYPDRNNPNQDERRHPITLDERLDRLEVAANQSQHTLARIVALMDGDPSYRIVGLPDQMAAYIKSNEDWKTATEKRVVSTEERIDRLEENKRLPVEPSTALLVIIILILLAVIVVMGLSRLQNAGQGAVAMSLLQIAAFAVQGNWRGTTI